LARTQHAQHGSPRKSLEECCVQVIAGAEAERKLVPFGHKGI
jgi:hypothetical protein